jgi:hypothetical protein
MASALASVPFDGRQRGRNVGGADVGGVIGHEVGK